MKRSIEVLTLLAIFGFMAFIAQRTEPVKLKSIGKYQLVQLGSMRRDQFLLDTENGNLWVMVCGVDPHGPDCDYQYWKLMDIQLLNATEDDIFKKAKAIGSFSYKKSH